MTQRHHHLTNVGAIKVPGWNTSTPAPPPPPPIAPTPPPRPGWRDHTWVWVQRHPWLTGLLALIATFIVFRIMWALCAAHQALRVHLFVIFLFWVLAIGTLPIVAIARTAGNALDKVFHDD